MKIIQPIKRVSALFIAMLLSLSVFATDELPDSLLLMHSQMDADTIRIVPVDTLSIFSGRTVSTETRVYSKTLLQMDSTTVTSIGSLGMTAEEGITVLDGTYVELGGELMLNGAGQYMVRFTYDASGNRIRREKDNSTK